MVRWKSRTWVEATIRARVGAGFTVLHSVLRVEIHMRMPCEQASHCVHTSCYCAYTSCYCAYTSCYCAYTSCYAYTFCYAHGPHTPHALSGQDSPTSLMPLTPPTPHTSHMHCRGRTRWALSDLVPNLNSHRVLGIEVLAQGGPVLLFLSPRVRGTHGDHTAPAPSQGSNWGERWGRYVGGQG